jgi:hypothetical protein
VKRIFRIKYEIGRGVWEAWLVMQSGCPVKEAKWRMENHGHEVKILSVEKMAESALVPIWVEGMLP